MRTVKEINVDIKKLKAELKLAQLVELWAMGLRFVDEKYVRTMFA